MTGGVANKAACFPKQVASAVLSTGSGLPRVSLSICTAASTNCSAIERSPSATVASSESTRVDGTTWGRGGEEVESLTCNLQETGRLRCSEEERVSSEGGHTEVSCVAHASDSSRGVGL